MSKLGHIIFGPNPINKRDPRLQLWRLRHWLFGPWMGCSCNKCFYNPRRIVHGGEAINVNQRLGNMDNRMDRLSQQIIDLQTGAKSWSALSPRVKALEEAQRKVEE